MKLALLRFPYVLHKSTQKLYLITDINIREFIGKDTKLLEDYEKEENKIDLDIIMSYLIRWNEKR